MSKPNWIRQLTPEELPATCVVCHAAAKYALQSHLTTNRSDYCAEHIAADAILNNRDTEVLPQELRALPNYKA